MKTSLAHLSVQKQQELKTIVQTVKRIGKPEMIILFGSYARGDWVTDRYVENGTTFDYQSDFDILVVVRDQKRQHHFPVWAQLEAEITRNKSISTPVSLIRDNIVFLMNNYGKAGIFMPTSKKKGSFFTTQRSTFLRSLGSLFRKSRKKWPKKILTCG